MIQNYNYIDKRFRCEKEALAGSDIRTRSLNNFYLLQPLHHSYSCKLDNTLKNDHSQVFIILIALNK